MELYSVDGTVLDCDQRQIDTRTLHRALALKLNPPIGCRKIEPRHSTFEPRGTGASCPPVRQGSGARCSRRREEQWPRVATMMDGARRASTMHDRRSTDARETGELRTGRCAFRFSCRGNQSSQSRVLFLHATVALPVLLARPPVAGVEVTITVAAVGTSGVIHRPAPVVRHPFRFVLSESEHALTLPAFRNHRLFQRLRSAVTNSFHSWSRVCGTSFDSGSFSL